MCVCVCVCVYVCTYAMYLSSPGCIVKGMIEEWAGRCERGMKGKVVGVNRKVNEGL